MPDDEKGRPPQEGGPQTSMAAGRGHSTTPLGHPAVTWLDGELAAVEVKLAAARATIATRGVVPRPAIRSATVALVAVDAAVSDLDVVRAMPATDEAVTP